MMDSFDLQAAMIRFHLLRVEESRPHLAALRDRIHELFPNMNASKADRLLAMLDEEVTRANIRWLQSAVNDPRWPRSEPIPGLDDEVEEEQAG